jgi:hypothetical protein
MVFRPWEYRTETGSAGHEVDLTGYSVAAVDGDIGHVQEATNELLGASYLLVDTGPWILGRKVMLPAGWSNGSTPPRIRSTSTGPRTRSRTHPSTTKRPTPPTTGSGSAATTPTRITLQTPRSDPGGQASDACRAASR